MVLMWDYDIDELKKTEEGRIFILERMINYGPDFEKGEKIKLSDVKKYWDKLDLYPDVKRLLEYLIWDKINPLPKSNGMLSIK